MKAGYAALLLMALTAEGPTPPDVVYPRVAEPGPRADPAGNRMVAFAATPRRPMSAPRDPFELHCTVDRHWCAALRQDVGGAGAWRIALTERNGEARLFPVSLPGDHDSAYGIWPHIIVEAGGAVLFGAERTRGTVYDGGGGVSVTEVILLRAEPGAGALRQVLLAPLEGVKDISACSDARDIRQRRNLCQDHYYLGATLALDPATRAGRPHLLYAARAQTWPGHRTPASASTTAPPLRRSDLRWAADPRCSFGRHFALDGGSARYVPDAALPACADYLAY